MASVGVEVKRGVSVSCQASGHHTIPQVCVWWPGTVWGLHNRRCSLWACLDSDVLASSIPEGGEHNSIVWLQRMKQSE